MHFMYFSTVCWLDKKIVDTVPHERPFEPRYNHHRQYHEKNESQNRLGVP